MRREGSSSEWEIGLQVEINGKSSSCGWHDVYAAFVFPKRDGGKERGSRSLCASTGAVHTWEWILNSVLCIVVTTWFTRKISLS